MNLETVLPSLAERIRKDHPELAPDDLVARSEVARYRSLYVQELMSAESGDLTEIERRVATALPPMKRSPRTSSNGTRAPGRSASASPTICQRGRQLDVHLRLRRRARGLDRPELFLGNRGAFDPYPFILLNLMLSCLAAVQAPIIMMSQRRQEAKDRLRSLNDYQVNLKAELEIRHLHEKIDHLLGKQWQRLAEIQQLQLEIMQDRRH